MQSLCPWVFNLHLCFLCAGECSELLINHLFLYTPLLRVGSSYVCPLPVSYWRAVMCCVDVLMCPDCSFVQAVNHVFLYRFFCVSVYVSVPCVPFPCPTVSLSFLFSAHALNHVFLYSFLASVCICPFHLSCFPCPNVSLCVVLMCPLLC